MEELWLIAQANKCISLEESTRTETISDAESVASFRVFLKARIRMKQAFKEIHDAATNQS